MNTIHSSAGAETTYTGMSWFVLAMITQPEIQKRAQAELDAVVGRSRTPAFSDFSSLPYVQAIVKEVLRWRPPLPLSIPHSTTEDDWYDGMFIPKGTICLPNLWLCHHDPAFYGPDAAMFNPGRPRWQRDSARYEILHIQWRGLVRNRHFCVTIEDFDLYAAADQFHTSAQLKLGSPRRCRFWQRKKNCSRRDARGL